MKKFSVKDDKIIVDNVGNVVARCTWKNAARRIVRLLNSGA